MCKRIKTNALFRKKTKFLKNRNISVIHYEKEGEGAQKIKQ